MPLPYSNNYIYELSRAKFVSFWNFSSNRGQSNAGERNRFLVWGDIEKMGPALAVSMLPILYGYTARLTSIALSRD